MLVVKTWASWYHAEMTSVGTDRDAFASVQIITNTVLHGGQLATFSTWTSPIRDANTQRYHKGTSPLPSSVLREQRWGQTILLLTPSFSCISAVWCPGSFTQGRTQMQEVSDTRFNKTSECSAHARLSHGDHLQQPFLLPCICPLCSEMV